MSKDTEEVRPAGTKRRTASNRARGNLPAVRPGASHSNGLGKRVLANCATTAALAAFTCVVACAIGPRALFRSSGYGQSKKSRSGAGASGGNSRDALIA